MEWIVDPLSSFTNLNPIWSETCPNVWYQCNCTGGLLVCTVKGGLSNDPPTEN